MDLFSVGRVEELLVILVLMLILFGPDRLPEMAVQLARFMRAFRQYSAKISQEFGETLHELEQEYHGIKGDWKDVGQGLSDGVRAVSGELRGAQSDVRQVIEETKPVNGPPGPASSAR